MNVNHPRHLLPDVMQQFSRSNPLADSAAVSTNGLLIETASPAPSTPCITVTRLRAGQSSRRSKPRQDAADGTDDAGHGLDQPEPSTDLAAAPERWNHGAAPDVVDAGTQRVRNGLIQLRSAGKIGYAECTAAERWYRDYALTVHGARDAGTGGSGDPGGAMDGALQAIEGYRRACSTLGMQGDQLLRAFVGAGLSFVAIGEAMKRDRKEVAGMIIATLGILVQHYANVDSFVPNARADIRSVEFGGR